MLPDVNIDKRDDVGAHIIEEILIDRGDIPKLVLTLVVNKPAPSGTLDGGSALVELTNELVERAPAINDAIVKRAAARQLAISRSTERVPEELMVEVTTTVEADSL